MITDQQLIEYKHWFNTYTKEYTSKGEESLIGKIDHTYQVCRNMRIITQSINLEEGDQNLAETIGLFHDLGRFIQFERYGTFADARSENHALLSVNVLRENNVLKDMKPSEEEFIFRCILNHNRFQLPKNESDKCMLFSRMLRDADKVDIFRVFCTFYENPESHSQVISLEMTDSSEISGKILASVLNYELANLKDMVNLTDFKILQLSWLFDLNFDATYMLLYKGNFVKKMLSFLPVNENALKISNLINTFFDEKIKRII